MAQMAQDENTKNVSSNSNGNNGNSGERKARFRVGAFAIIERDGHYLLARRRDIGWWNLAGGGMEYGETVEEALRREVREEVGVDVEIERVVGIYSKPQKSEVVMTFLAHLADSGATPGTSDEVSEVAWFAPDDLPDKLLPKHRQRLEDALLDATHTLLRTQRSTTEDDQGLGKPM